MDLIKTAQNLDLGLKRGTVDLCPYSPKWAQAYQVFAQKISGLSKDPIRIEHVGSTALPDGIAKPILDLLLVYQDRQTFHQKILPALTRLGFTAKGEMGIAGREFFAFYDKAQAIDHVHIHAFIEGHEHIKRMLVFRDHLLNSRQDCEAYNYHKLALKKAEVSRKDYPNAKSSFVRNILQQEASSLLHLEVTSKTYLELLEPKDHEVLFALVDADRDHLSPFLPWVQWTKVASDHLPFIEMTWQQYLRDDGWQVKIIHEGKLCGMVGFHHIDRQQKATTIGYWLASAYCGQGIITQTVSKMIKHAFDVWDLTSVTIRCHKDNKASRAIPLRLGFQEQPDSDADHFLYTMVRSDF